MNFKNIYTFPMLMDAPKMQTERPKLICEKHSLSVHIYIMTII